MSDEKSTLIKIWKTTDDNLEFMANRLGLSKIETVQLASKALALISLSDKECVEIHDSLKETARAQEILRKAIEENLDGFKDYLKKYPFKRYLKR